MQEQKLIQVAADLMAGGNYADPVLLDNDGQPVIFWRCKGNPLASQWVNVESRSQGKVLIARMKENARRPAAAV